MKTARRLMAAAGWCILLFGLIHQSAFIYSYVNMTDAEPVVQAMKAYPIEGTPTHLYSFYNGYALLMGWLLIAFGIFYIILARQAAHVLLGSRVFMTFSLVVAVVMCALSTVYFAFAVPIVLTSLAVVCLLFASLIGYKAVAAEYS